MSRYQILGRLTHFHEYAAIRSTFIAFSQVILSMYPIQIVNTSAILSRQVSHIESATYWN